MCLGPAWSRGNTLCSPGCLLEARLWACSRSVFRATVPGAALRSTSACKEMKLDPLPHTTYKTHSKT